MPLRLTCSSAVGTGVWVPRRVAQLLDIPYYVMNFRDDFQKSVIDYFVDEYKKGCTPNPCNACNRHVKWEALLTRAKEIGADYIATGHYARIKQLENGRYTIQNSVTATKDQTYALYNLTQDQLAYTLMPVGAYTKDEIREIAQRIQLPVAHKQDSQDICFIPDGDYASFIKKETGAEFAPGNFVDVDGNILGQHKGIIHYTVGQRKGLGLALQEPMYVYEKRMDTNEVVLCRNEELFSSVLEAEDVNWIIKPEEGKTIHCRAKARYKQKEADAEVESLDNGRVRVTFAEPQRGITTGQSVVFYDGDTVLGGGRIL